VAEGTPEAVAANERSFTGQYLRETLAKSPIRSPAEAGVQAPKARKRAKKAEAEQADLLAAK
jgi:excinuclease ABC subunit A